MRQLWLNWTLANFGVFQTTSNLEMGWNATKVAPKQCFDVGQDQKQEFLFTLDLLQQSMSYSLKNWLNKIFEQKFKWRWYACKVKLHESFISQIVLDLYGSGVSICITQITLHNIQLVLVFKQKSWNTNCKQTYLAPVVYNYWHNVLIKVTRPSFFGGGTILRWSSLVSSPLRLS